MRQLVPCIVCLTIVCVTSGAVTVRAESPHYNRDIRPILGANCFECHGPDENTRESDLRLDQREAALADLGGYVAIKPGDATASEVIARIMSDDPDAVMPPPSSNKTLTKKQKETLRLWVDAGAEYEPHWSFAPPQRPVLPEVSDSDWCRNEIDRFVLARLDSEGLSPSPEADPYTLVRRLYLDLIGIPPTPEQADDFVNENDPQAYEALVQQLLQSPRYGEKWARHWLDLARYADTNGYEKDRDRSIWPYRDWVIHALNNDMPFDQFTIEQLAGDMLPHADASQRIATGFHRNTMLNEEGGIDPLEYRYLAMVDRVATTGTVWMGLTTGCAQCHTHKFDPITHTDYYALMALLDNADEPDLIVADATVEGRRAEIAERIAALEAMLPSQFPPQEGDGPEDDRRQRHFEQRFDKWLVEMRSKATPWSVMKPTQMKTNLPRLEVLDDGSVFSTGDITKRDVFDLRFELPASDEPVTAVRLEVLPDPRLPARGPGRAFYEGRKGDFFLSELTLSIDQRPLKVGEASASFGKIGVGSGKAEPKNVLDGDGDTGWSSSTREGERHTLVLTLDKPLTTPATLDVSMLFQRHYAASLGRFRLSVTSHQGAAAIDLPEDVERALLGEPESLSDVTMESLRRAFARVATELAEARKPIDRLRKTMPNETTTMVMQERPTDNRRTTHRHHRGEYLQTKEPVDAAVPSRFPQIPEEVTADRLSFARWLVSERNPLAGRVVANRAWQALFGRGIVRTSEDFGTQGELPSHPVLLDWLAVEFVHRDWSMKELHRQIVTSATYRQSSHVTAERLTRDAKNVLLARGPRFRVPAETVRDIGLSVSELLSAKLGGPSVYPPQPASVTALAYGNVKWEPSKGEDRYRRSLYTFSKRTAPFAAFSVFDAPTGENCLARRDRSNTALQALTMLNDPMFLEMAEALAAEVVSTEKTPKKRAAAIVRRCVTRPATDAEVTALTTFADKQRRRLEADELDAEAICVHHKPSNELAAWVMAARVVLNLDETITKP